MSATDALQARAASSEHGSPRKSARQSKGLCPKCNQQVGARWGCMQTLTHANTLTLTLATTHTPRQVTTAQIRVQNVLDGKYYHADCVPSDSVRKVDACGAR